MIRRKLKDIIEEGRYSPEDGILFWRERILKITLLIIIIFGFIPYILGSYIGIKFGYTELPIVNSISYFTIIYIFISKKLSLFFRIFVIIVIGYIIGLCLIFLVGPEASGLSYLIAASLLSALLLGLRGSIGTLILNIILFAFIALGLHLDWFNGMNIDKYSVSVWITVASSAEIICLISSVPLAIVLKGLDKTVLKQKKLQLELQEKISQLDTAKQEAEESDRLKTNFLANMSHEVRTPLNAIMGFTELMIFEAYADEQEKNKYLKTIHNSGTYLLNILKNILDFSVIESGQLKLHKREFSVKKLFNEVSPMYSVSFVCKESVKIYFEMQDNADIKLYSDIDRIKQVLINLINNALKNTESGTINVGFRGIDEFIEFYVKDTGCGIPNDKIKDIFKRFVKIEGKNKIIKGTGLGLPISKGIINALGGEIRVESEIGKGSTFIFTIPAKG
jgi:signal transduction histidine kinase